jgi:hypothetical protein
MASWFEIESATFGKKMAVRDDNKPQADTRDAWRDAAKKHEGSWWTEWADWLGERAGEMVTPPAMGSKKHPPIMDSPGATFWRSRHEATPAVTRGQPLAQAPPAGAAPGGGSEPNGSPASRPERGPR